MCAGSALAVLSGQTRSFGWGSASESAHKTLELHALIRAEVSTSATSSCTTLSTATMTAAATSTLQYV